MHAILPPPQSLSPTRMHPAQVFISYRRDDTAGYARAIYDELAQHFGADRVFIDVDDISAGQPFSEVIARAVGTSAALLVLIGRRWRGERESGPPRIDDAGDFPRREVAAGLVSGILVIPVLLDGAALPDAAQLPAELRPLLERNALAVDNARFAADIGRLVAAVRLGLGEPAAPAPRRRTALRWGLAGAMLVTAMAVLWTWRAAPRPAINGEWQAEVTYDWPNAHYVERFGFRGEGGELQGSASFLGVARGVLEGRVEAEGLSFVTRTGEMVGGAGTAAEVVHRYRGRLVGGEVRFVMQTEGGSQPHVPIEFVARRVAPAASQAGR
jgi:TIR domain